MIHVTTVIIIALLLAACGGGDSSAPEKTTPAEAPKTLDSFELGNSKLS